MLTAARRREQAEVVTRTINTSKNLLLILSTVAVVMLLSAPARAQQATLTDDTSYPKSGNGGGQGGGQGGGGGQAAQSELTLKVRGPGVANGAASAFVKFKLTGATPTNIGDLPSGTPGSHVAKATLKLFVSGIGTAGSFDLYRVTGPWAEGDAAAPTYDAASPVATGVQVVAAGSFVTIDITPLVRQWLDFDPNNPAAGGLPNHGVALVASAAAPSTSVEFDSKEATQTSHQAQLGVVIDHAKTADQATNADHAATADSAANATTADSLSAVALVPGSQVSGDIAGRASSITGNVSGSQVSGPVVEATHAANADHANTASVATTVSAPLTLSSADPSHTLSVVNTGGGAAVKALGNIDATTHYSIGGRRVLGVGATTSVFAGLEAGAANTGANNSFFGFRAGFANTTGVVNSFFGTQGGRSNTTGSANSFFGGDAGRSNTTGNSNVFVGASAGLSNTTESGNTFVGAGANGAPGVVNATAIGAGAQVTQSNTMVLGTGALTVRVPGDLHVAGTISGTFGGPLPAGSANYIQNTTTQQAASNFNISGDGTAGGALSAGVVKAASHYELGGVRLISAPGSNTSVGVSAGGAAGGSHSSFFGNSAGSRSAAGNNSFFGALAGALTTTGQTNSFFGAFTGANNATGEGNSFFGSNAGSQSTTGSNNTFVGTGTGQSNTTGSNNVFVGNIAGFTNTTEANNTYIGAGARGTPGVNNSTAIGANAEVSSSNTMVLGTSIVNVSIPGSLNVSGGISGNFTGTVPADSLNGVVPVSSGGTGLSSSGATGSFLRSDGSSWTSAALTAADVPAGNTSYIQNTTAEQAGSNFSISGDGTLGGTLSANAVNASTQYNIRGERVLSIAGSNNVFVGFKAGAASPTSGDFAQFGGSNAFFGSHAGVSNTRGFGNTAIGTGAGGSTTIESFNTFLGFAANATPGIFNATAIGANAQVTQSNSIVLGGVSGANGANAGVNVGIGTTAPTQRLDVNGNVKISGEGSGLIFPDGSAMFSAVIGGLSNETSTGSNDTAEVDFPAPANYATIPNMSAAGVSPGPTGKTIVLGHVSITALSECDTFRLRLAVDGALIPQWQHRVRDCAESGSGGEGGPNIISVSFMAVITLAPGQHTVELKVGSEDGSSRRFQVYARDMSLLLF